MLNNSVSWPQTEIAKNSDMDNPEQKPRIRKATRIESVMNSAMWHLTQRDMTEHELISKLKVKTDNQEWIDEVLQRLRDFGYLKSNQDFAEQFVEQSFFGEFGSSYILEKLEEERPKRIRDL